MPAIVKNDRKVVTAWCMYDWANSAYVTTVSVGLLGPYMLNVVVPELRRVCWT